MQTSVSGHAFQNLGHLSSFSCQHGRPGDQSLDPEFVFYRFVQTAVKSSHYANLWTVLKSLNLVSLRLYLPVRVQPDSSILLSTED